VSNYAGCTPASHCWCWVDERGTPKYIGHGTTSVDGEPPWQRLWLQRERVGGPLGEWLRSLSAQPALDWRTVPASPLTASAAAQLCQLLRRRGGVQLLTARDYTGSGRMVPALGYRSLRELARQLGVSRRRAATLAGWDHDGRSGSPDFDDCADCSDSDGSKDCPASEM
jgi:hypothetical protein